MRLPFSQFLEKPIQVWNSCAAGLHDYSFFNVIGIDYFYLLLIPLGDKLWFPKLVSITGFWVIIMQCLCNACGISVSTCSACCKVMWQLCHALPADRALRWIIWQRNSVWKLQIFPPDAGSHKMTIKVAASSAQADLQLPAKRKQSTTITTLQFLENLFNIYLNYVRCITFFKVSVFSDWFKLFLSA